MFFVRLLLFVVGTLTLVFYTVLAIAGLLLLQWLVSNPPDPILALSVFLVVILIGGYVGYRLGTVRLVSSLETSRLTRVNAPRLFRRLEDLTARMGTTEPTLLVAKLEAPNALSVGGPRDGAIILDERLLNMLTLEELEAILAHELAHIESYDTFVNTLAVTAVRSITGLLLLVLFPLVLFLRGIDRATAWYSGRPGRRQLGLTGLFLRVIAVSIAVLLSVFTITFLAHARQQEYRADRRAVMVTGNPLALARALRKIQRATEPQRGLHSLLYIHDERETEPGGWLSTHPSLEKRIRRLRELTESVPRSPPS